MQPSPLSNSRMLSPPQKEIPYLLAVTLIPTVPGSLYLHSVSMDLSSLNYSVNGIIQQVAFHVWLISLSIMFLRLIYGFGVSFWGNENVLELDKVPQLHMNVLNVIF